MADVSLTAAVDTSGVAAGMASIENTVQRTAHSVGSMLSGAFSAAAIVAEIDKVLNAAEEIHKQSARFGIDAEQLQKISNAAKEVGINSEQVARTLNLIAINAQKALDPTTQQALAMEQLNISAKAFAAASPWERVLMLAGAWGQAADKGAAYSEIADITGKKNTEFIALLSQGSVKIQEFADKFPVLAKAQIYALSEIKEKEKQYIADFDSWAAKSVVGFADALTTIKNKVTDFNKWMADHGMGWLGDPRNNPALSATAGLPQASPPGDWTTGSAILPKPTPAAAVPAEPVVPTEPTVPSVKTGGGGSGSTAEWLSGLNAAQKINTLLTERAAIQTKLDSQDLQGDEHAATRYSLEQQLEKVDQALLPLRQQLNIEEQKGVEAADRRIVQSQNDVEIQNLRNQALDAENNGQEQLARYLNEEAELLQINLSFDEKIQRAIDAANDARSKGLEQTAQENELLADQLETEKQNAIQLEQQRQARQAAIDLMGKSPLTIGALAQGNMRLGATSDTYAAALAASRGLKPGTPEYERLVQQINAQDQLMNLQGRSISSGDQLNRDKLVQWFAGTQQQKATAVSDQSHRDEIAFWEAILSGGSAPAGNPFSGRYGVSPFISGNMIPGGQGSSEQIAKLSTQIDLLQQAVISLQGIQKNTEVVHI